MTFFRSLILGVMTFSMATATAEMKVSHMDVNSDYIRAVKALFLSIDMEGAGRATITEDKYYNTHKDLSGYSIYDDNQEFYRVPQQLLDEVKNSAHCDLDIVGGCFAVETSWDGKPTAYYYTVAPNVLIQELDIFRKQVDMEKLGTEVRIIYDAVKGDFENLKDVRVTHSQASGFVKRVWPDKGFEREKEETPEQIRTEKAQIKMAILKNKPIDPALLRKHLPIQTEISAAEAQRMEAEAETVYQAGGKSFKEIRAKNLGSDMMTCYPVGKLQKQKGRFFIAFNAIFRNKMKPDLKGKGKLLCYNDGQLVAKINIEMKKFGLGLGLAIPSGTYYALSVGAGVADGPIDIITRKLEDGKLETFREWAMVAGVDAGYGIGGSLSVIGLSSGRFQRPLISLFNASFAKDVLGLSADVFSIGRIGLDPDDF